MIAVNWFVTVTSDYRQAHYVIKVADVTAHSNITSGTSPNWR